MEFISLVIYFSAHLGEACRAGGQLEDAANVDRIANGLRHSCISYSLAANPEHGVALTAQWAGNSENTIRHHYRRLLKKADGDAWFAVQEFWREIEAKQAMIQPSG